MTAGQAPGSSWVVEDDRLIVRSAVASALRERWPEASVREVGGTAGVVRAGDGVRKRRIDDHGSIVELIESLASSEEDLAAPVSGPRFSRRQSTVRHLVESGLTAAEIGQRLGISARTVEAHKSAVRAAQRAC